MPFNFAGFLGGGASFGGRRRRPFGTLGNLVDEGDQIPAMGGDQIPAMDGPPPPPPDAAPPLMAPPSDQAMRASLGSPDGGGNLYASPAQGGNAAAMFGQMAPSVGDVAAKLAAAPQLGAPLGMTPGSGNPMTMAGGAIGAGQGLLAKKLRRPKGTLPRQGMPMGLRPRGQGYGGPGSWSAAGPTGPIMPGGER